MIDFHSHIVYGVDDGSINEEMTVNMLRLAEKSGTEIIVATPHFFRGRFEATPNEINKRIDIIRGLAFENNINIKLCCGQEIRYDQNILDYYLNKDITTINNSRYMLIELSMKDFSIHDVINDVYELQLKGIVPILAHPERYEMFKNKPKLVERFIEEGYLFQLNVGSLDGDYGKESKKLANMFLKNRLYSVLGSDAHGVESRNTDMRIGLRIIDKKCPGYLQSLMKNSESILKNEVVNFEGYCFGKQSVFKTIKDKFY